MKASAEPGELRAGEFVVHDVLVETRWYELGRESTQKVVSLLAYTNDEWDIDLPAKAG